MSTSTPCTPLSDDLWWSQAAYCRAQRLPSPWSSSPHPAPAPASPAASCASSASSVASSVSSRRENKANVADSTAVACALLRQCVGKLETMSTTLANDRSTFEDGSAEAKDSVLSALREASENEANGGRSRLPYQRRRAVSLPTMERVLLSAPIDECLLSDVDAFLESATVPGRAAFSGAKAEATHLLRDCIDAASAILKNINVRSERTSVLLAEVCTQRRAVVRTAEALRYSIAKRPDTRQHLQEASRRRYLTKLKREGDSPSPYLVRFGRCVGHLPASTAYKVEFHAEACKELLTHAVRTQDVSSTLLLLQCGMSPNSEHQTTSVLHYCARLDALEVAKILLQYGAQLDPQNKAGFTPLATAVLHWSHRVMSLLLAMGADANRSTLSGETPLTLAAARQCPRVAGLLLSHGADPHHVTENGASVLGTAVFHCCYDLVEALLGLGVGVNHCDANGDTALLIACLQVGGDECGAPLDHVGVVKSLLAHGAAVNRRNRLGNTALIHAAYVGSLEVVALLLEQGADTSAANDKGQTAYSICSDPDTKALLSDVAQRAG